MGGGPRVESGSSNESPDICATAHALTGVRRASAGTPMKSPFLDGVLAVGVITVALTEGLSLFHGLNRATVCASWAVVAVMFLVWRGRSRWHPLRVDARLSVILGVTAVNGPVTINSAHVALCKATSAVDSTIDTATDKALAFSGTASVTIASNCSRSISYKGASLRARA